MWKFAKVTSAKNAIFAVFQFLVVFAELTFTFELMENLKRETEMRQLIEEEILNEIVYVK